MGILLWYPVLVPQISGGLKPLIPVTANLSLHVPIGVVTANPDIVAKSSLQTSMIVGGSNLRQKEKSPPKLADVVVGLVHSEGASGSSSW